MWPLSCKQDNIRGICLFGGLMVNISGVYDHNRLIIKFEEDILIISTTTKFEKA